MSGPGTLSPARRRTALHFVSKAGDYYGPTRLVNADGEQIGRMVWFLLPIHEGRSKWDRPTRGSGLHGVDEPPWTFRECADGSLEIRASIACGRHEEGGEYWHGYLDAGNVWRQV